MTLRPALHGMYPYEIECVVKAPGATHNINLRHEMVGAVAPTVYGMVWCGLSGFAGNTATCSGDG